VISAAHRSHHTATCPVCRLPLLTQHPALFDGDTAMLASVLKGAEHASLAEVDTAFCVPLADLPRAAARRRGGDDASGDAGANALAPVHRMRVLQRRRGIVSSTQTGRSACVCYKDEI
jgi:hypothetical protein